MSGLPRHARNRRLTALGSVELCVAKIHDVEYHTVFDVSQNGYLWAYPLVIVLFAGLFALIGWAMRQSKQREYRVIGIAFPIAGGIGMFAGLLYLVSNYIAFRDYAKALSNHDYAVAEGVVTGFVPMPRGGHADESFRIGQTKFLYGSGWGSLVFNSELNTGFLHNGVRARITYRGADILKVEVR